MKESEGNPLIVQTDREREKEDSKKLRGPNPTHQNLTPMHPKQRADKDLTLLHFRFIFYLLLLILLPLTHSFPCLHV